MARELEIKIWCDPCFVEDIKTEGEELAPVALAGTKPKVLAMCERHRKELYDPFVAVLTEYGVTLEQLGRTRPGVKKSPTASSASEGAPPSQATDSSTGRPVQCPDCTESRKNPAGVSKHLRSEHGKSLFEAIGPGGTLYDIDGVAVDTPKARPRRNGG